MSKFTICVLLYGDYPVLAERCLTSIINTVYKKDLNLRIGLNEVPEYISNWVKDWCPAESIFEAENNIHKYPMMRRMLHGSNPVDTEYTMWFDDDSYLVDHHIDNTKTYWLDKVAQSMANADMLGAIYHMNFVGKQKDYIAKQPWYTGKSLETRKKIKFITGGWWTIKSDILKRFDYPWVDLDHCGGDTLLGELAYQNDLTLTNFTTGVKINADEMGQSGKASRRGFSQPPLGAQFAENPGDTLNRATSKVTL